jgi:hypothetical protein
MTIEENVGRWAAATIAHDTYFDALGKGMR